MFAQNLHEQMLGILRGLQINLFDRRQFVLNLQFMYQVIRASEQLLVIAIAQSSGKMKEFFQAHLEEERDHASWLFADLARSGEVPAPWINEAVQFTGSQYYHLIHTNPLMLVGYMFLLEGFPLSAWHVQQLEELHGKELCRTLRHHAEHDVQHFAELTEFINSLSDAEQRLVEVAAIEATRLLVKSMSDYMGVPK